MGQIGEIDEAQAVMTDALTRFGETFRRLLSLPLDQLRELCPAEREHLLDGLRKARITP